MKKYSFYRHWYISEYGEQLCTGWQERDWYEYLGGTHRDSLDMGEDSNMVHLETEEKIIEKKD